MISLAPESPVLDPTRASAGQIHSWLRAEVLSARLRPGTPLSENEIATRLGVSRTPVREAFIRLAGEGLLTVRPQVGTTVAAIDVDAVADSQFLRETIECRTVALAASRISGAAARELRRLLRDLERRSERRDPVGYLLLDDELHRRLLCLAGRPRLWAVVEGAKAQFDRVRALSLEDPGWLSAIHAQHADIVGHVIAGEAEAAAAAMCRHLTTVYPTIDRIATRFPEYFARIPGSPTRASDTIPSGRHTKEER